MQRFDPKVWGDYGFSRKYPLPSHHRRAGYYESLLWVYLELNLLLVVPEGVPPIMMVWNRFPFALGIALGEGESGHPLHLASHLMPAFPRGKLAPLTPDVLKVLRDHAAMMFRCMYSVSGDNKLLDRTVVEAVLFEFFEWRYGESMGIQKSRYWDWDS